MDGNDMVKLGIALILTAMVGLYGVYPEAIQHASETSKWLGALV